MSTLKLLLVGLGTRVTMIAISIVNSILLARRLGPAGIGEYFLLMRLVTVLTVLVGFGLMQSANVFSSQYEEWVGRIHSILLRFTLLTWIGASIIGIGVIWLAGNILLPGIPQKWVWLCFIILPFSLYANFWYGLMIGRGRIWQLNLVQLVASIAFFVLTLVFVVGLSGGVTAAVINYLLVTVAQFFIMLIMAFRMSSDRNVGDSPPDLSRQILGFGLRAYPGTISTLLCSHIPIFLLNAFHGAAAVGIFSIAQQLVERLLLPMQAMQDAIFKNISVLPAHAATIVMNRYIRLTWWTMTILMLLGVIFAPVGIMLLLGEQYLKAAQVFRLLLPSTVMTSACVILAVYFLGQLRRPGLLSIFSWLNALITLALSLAFIPKLAESGAALALVMGQLLSGICIFIFYMRRTQTSVKQLIYSDKEDIRIVRQQVGAIWSRKGMGDE